MVCVLFHVKIDSYSICNPTVRVSFLIFMWLLFYVIQSGLKCRGNANFIGGDYALIMTPFWRLLSLFVVFRRCGSVQERATY